MQERYGSEQTARTVAEYHRRCADAKSQRNTKIARELNAPFFHDIVVAHSEGSHSGGIFFADPDGIRLEIFAPTGAEESPAPGGEAPTCGFF